MLNDKNKAGKTPLMLAEAQGEKGVPKIIALIKKGADCSNQDTDGNTILHRIINKITIALPGFEPRSNGPEPFMTGLITDIYNF